MGNNPSGPPQAGTAQSPAGPPQVIPGPSAPLPIPDPWLDQIRDTVKNAVKDGSSPKLWVTLLGSSVLAALIGAGSSYLTVRTTGLENIDLELKKAQIQQTTERAKAIQTAYDKLRGDIDRLSDQLEGTRILIDAAGSHASADDKAKISAELRRIGQDASTLLESNTNRLIDPAVSGAVNKALRTLWQSLAAAQADTAKLKGLSNVIAKTETELKSAEQALDSLRAPPHPG